MVLELPHPFSVPSQLLLLFPVHFFSASYPSSEFLSPIRVEVRAGETLYLPAFTYHRVAQRGRRGSGEKRETGGKEDGLTIAVNYWFDCQFGYAYCYHQFLESMVSS